jgi:hypothetical protein
MSYLITANHIDISKRENFYNFSSLRRADLTTPSRNPISASSLNTNDIEKGLKLLATPPSTMYVNSQVQQTLGYDTLNIPANDIYNLYNEPNFSPIGDTPTINDPLRVAEKLASDRDWETGKDFCKNRRTKFGLFDIYGRQANQNSVHWSDCAGDDPNVAMERDQRIQRMEFDSYAPYQVSIPRGLLM